MAEMISALQKDGQTTIILNYSIDNSKNQAG